MKEHTDQTEASVVSGSSAAPMRAGTIQAAFTLAIIAMMGWTAYTLRDRLSPGRAETRMLEEGNVRERRRAAREVAKIAGRAYDRVSLALAERLTKDTDAIVRAEAARSLGLATDVLARNGASSTSAGPAVAALRKGLRDIDSHVRERAANALGLFAKWVPTCPEELVGLMLADPEPEVRMAASGAIGRFQTAGPDSVKRLFEGMDHADPAIQRLASNTLGQINPTSESLPTLLVVLRHERNEVRCRAMDLLGRLGTEAAEAVPAVIENLKLPSPRVAGDAAQMIPPFDPGYFAAMVLGRIAPGTKWAKPAINALADSVGKAEESRMEVAAQSLIDFGEEAAPALDVILDALERALEPPQLGQYASSLAQAVGVLGPESPRAERAVALLIRTLGCRSEFAKSRAANALAKFGRHGLPALPALEALQTDRSLSVRYEANRAIFVLSPMRSSKPSEPPVLQPRPRPGLILDRG